MPETDMPETDMLQHIPAPAEPLPAKLLNLQPPASLPALNARWHEIQANLVDDPHSSAEIGPPSMRASRRSWRPSGSSRIRC